MRTSLKQRAAQASLNSRMCRDCKIGSKACTKRNFGYLPQGFCSWIYQGK